MSPPRWATNLVERVARDYQVRRPVLEWRQRRKKRSAGSAALDQSHISVSAGSDKKDQRLTLLHELAHFILLQRGTRGEHDSRFWELTWELFRRYRVPIWYALTEQNQTESLLAYRRTRRRVRKWN